MKLVPLLRRASYAYVGGGGDGAAAAVKCELLRRLFSSGRQIIR